MCPIVSLSMKMWWSSYLISSNREWLMKNGMRFQERVSLKYLVEMWSIREGTCLVSIEGSLSLGMHIDPRAAHANSCCRQRDKSLLPELSTWLPQVWWTQDEEVNFENINPLPFMGYKCTLQQKIHIRVSRPSIPLSFKWNWLYLFLSTAIFTKDSWLLYDIIKFCLRLQ